MIIHTVEQGTLEWHALRAGMPTASNFSSLLTSKGELSKSLDSYALTLAGEKYAGKPLEIWEGNQWTERGKELEAEAIKLYEFANDAKVDRVGFITDDAATYGCSPDGLCGGGMVEIKCLKPENHIKAILYYQKNGSCPTDYVQQTQGQMFITNRPWCDLIFYHPALPMLTIRQAVDRAFTAKLTEAITAVCKERDRVLAALKQQNSPLQKEAAE